MTHVVKLNAKVREVTGKSSHKLAPEGLIPAVVYGPKIETQSLSVDRREFDRRATRVLATLRNLDLFRSDLPNKAYNTKTGEKVGEIDLGALKGSLTNFYNTADDDGNVLICNLAPNAGSFKVYKLTSVTSTPELMIEWNGGVAIGRKLSVAGSIDGDAIITAPILAAGQKFARWKVTGGVLASQEPEVVTMTGLAKGWTTNWDIVYTSATDVNSDYFVASYSDNTFAWVDGTTSAS